MCGLVGILGPKSVVSGDRLSVCLDVIAHRGPNDEGVQWIKSRTDFDKILAFGHRRLAILDLSERGHQPMIDPNTQNCIIYNGEIYNFKALRSELEKDGARFHS